MFDGLVRARFKIKGRSRIKRKAMLVRSRMRSNVNCYVGHMTSVLVSLVLAAFAGLSVKMRQVARVVRFGQWLTAVLNAKTVEISTSFVQNM